LRERDETIRLTLSEEIRESFGKANDDEIHRVRLEIEKTRSALEEEQSKPVEWEITRFTNLFGETEEARFDKTKEKKHHLREQIKALESNLHRATDRDTEIDATAKQLAAWDPYDQNAAADFFDPEWMFGLTGGFDVVIGNPPYGALITEQQKKYLTAAYKYQDYQFDTYLLFVEKSVGLSRTSGSIALIIPNTWLLNLLSKKLRKWIFAEKTISTVVHFTADFRAGRYTRISGRYL
jgi:hypothetical protein